MLQTPTVESKESAQAVRTVAVPTSSTALHPNAGRSSSLAPATFYSGELSPGLAASQRNIGNRAMLRTLARPTTAIRPPVISQPTAPPLQRKLEIGAVNDPLEAEADRVAEHVTRMPDPAIAIRSATPHISRKCAACEEEDQKKVQRKPTGEAKSAGEVQPLVQDVLRSPGRSLDSATRAFMEPRFGADFSGVRVHDDAQATKSAKSVHALAYTVGNNVVFNTNQYRPASVAGQRLLAHELTHVVQQSGESKQRLRRKELPDEETPKEWPLPSQFNEGDEQCRWEEGDLKCYKVTCIQTPEKKTHCFYDGPHEHAPAPEPDKKAPPPQAPAAKQAVTGTDSKGQFYVVYDKEIRVGGTRPWHNNNPGNFDKPSDHPKNIGNDGRFLIFPDPATGKQELIDSIKAHGTSTIRSFITVHAPPSENDTEQYITDVLNFMNNGDKIGECKITKPAKPVSDGTVIGNLNDADQTSLAMAMARKEGWCDVVQKKALYTCQSASVPDEYKKKLTCP